MTTCRCTPWTASADEPWIERRRCRAYDSRDELVATYAAEVSRSRRSKRQRWCGDLETIHHGLLRPGTSRSPGPCPGRKAAAKDAVDDMLRRRCI